MAAAAAFVLLVLLFATPAISKARDEYSKIPVSSELRPGTNSSVWISESGTFAFGFYGTRRGYAVCIFLAGISEKTVVWTANKFDPILPNNVVALSIEEQGLLIWHITQENSYSIYDRIAAPERTAASAAMLDSGNFVLYDSGGGTIWQSFDYPTHALLPGQRLRSGHELVSRASDRDLAIGMFRLKMQSDGNLVQYPVSTSDTGENAYYASGTFEAGGNFSLNLDNDGRLYLYGSGESRYNLTSGGGGGGGGVYLARVDPDGIFRLYNRSLALEGAWTAVWRSTEEKCGVKGICGANTFCTSREDRGVECTCLPGFGDGCREDFDAGDCRWGEKRRVRYGMMRVRNVTWIDNYYEVIDGTVSEEGCAVACVDDCNCVVAFFDDGSCRKQRLPLRYGVKSKSVSNTALVRVTLPSPSPVDRPSPGPSPPQLAQPPDSSGKIILLIHYPKPN